LTASIGFFSFLTAGAFFFFSDIATPPQFYMQDVFYILLHS